MPQIRITREYIRTRFLLVSILIFIASAISHQTTRRTFEHVVTQVEAVYVFEDLLTVLIEASIHLEALAHTENAVASGPNQSKLYRSSEALLKTVEEIHELRLDGTLGADAIALLENPTLDLFGVIDDFNFVLEILSKEGGPWGHDAVRYVSAAHHATDQILPVIKRLSEVELLVLDRANQQMLQINNIILVSISILLLIVGAFIYRPMELRIVESHEEIRKKQKQAEAASVAKSQFLANMSHEIRTPMNGVLGMAEVLDNTRLTQDQHDMVRVISDSGKSLMTIIEDILDFSKIEAKKNVLENRPFSFKAISTHLHKLFEPTASTKGLRLVWIDDEHIAPSLVGDKGRIQQIITNLVGNAIKFTNTGSVVVRVVADPIVAEHQRINIIVEDSGVGIAEDQVERIFQQFEQADTSSTRKFGGTGLGLAISSALAHEMHGHIDVESTLGEGAKFTFSVSLPVYDELRDNNENSGDYVAPPTPYATLDLQ